jgi:FkbM family methyltransferase
MIKSLLKNNKIAQRIKAVKDLLLEKLDNLALKSDQQAGQLSSLLEENTRVHFNTSVLLEKTQEIQSIGNNLTDNSILLLKSSIDTVKVLQHLLDDSQWRQEKIENILAEMRTESQQSLAEMRTESQQSLAEMRTESQQSLAEMRTESQQSLAKVQTESQQLLSEIRTEFQQYYQYTMQKLIEVQEDSRNQNILTSETLTNIYVDIHNQKFKVVTDQAYFQDIDIELMVYLYSYLPHHRAIDIGANRGDVSNRLIDAGYEVYAFEPFPPVLEKLTTRLGDNHHFHIFSFAVGSANETRDLHIAADQTEDQIYGDATFYSSLTEHSLSEGLVFSETTPVTVKTLASLHESAELPIDIGLVKIDTEGFDLEVIKGMGQFIYPVVVAEFWDANFPFGRSGAMNHLKDMVKAMRERNYRWHIVIYRIWGSHDISYYCNSAYSLDNSWGNVFFFKDYEVFSEALKWCSSVMPATYFSV